MFKRENFQISFAHSKHSSKIFCSKLSLFKKSSLSKNLCYGETGRSKGGEPTNEQFEDFCVYGIQLENVEAMSSKVILMMPKNQELSKVSSKDSRIKFQDSRFKIQE